MNRIRFKDYRKDLITNVQAETYSRSPTCNDALQWRASGAQNWVNQIGRLVTMSDTTVPKYKKRVAQGEVFFNPCEIVDLEILEGSSSTRGQVIQSVQTCGAPNNYYWQGRHTLTGSIGRVYSGFDFTRYQNGMLVPPVSIISAGEISSLRTEVSTACLNAIGRSDSNLYESLAQIDQAIGTLPNIFRNGLAIAMVKSKGLYKAKAAGSAYLAIRYGLMPIMKDVESVMLGIKQQVGKVRRTFRSQGSTSMSKTSVRTVAPFATYDCRITSTTQETYTIRAMTLGEYYATVGSNIGFTSKGLATLPWELLPYSFVIDWFANVGDFLGALVPDANMTTLGSCLVVKREFRTDDSLTTVGGLGGTNIVTPLDGSCSRIYKTYSRVPGALSSGLVIKNDFRFRNVTRAADALALLVQKLR